MPWTQPLRRAISHAFSLGRRRRLRRPAAPPRARPFLETLEDRLAPSITLTSFNVPPSGPQGQPLSFSAQAVDSQGAPLDYTWNFGDSTARGR